MKFQLLSAVIFTFLNSSAIALVDCSLSNVTYLNFGNVNPYDADDKTLSTSFLVTCNTSEQSDSVSYTITFSTGVSNDQSARTMNKTASIKERYNIYSNTSYVSPLGNGFGGSSVITNSYNFSNTRTDMYTIYGKIPSQPIAISGDYNDSIMITLTW